MAEGQTQGQEINTTMTYKVNLDSTQMALGLGQVRQGVDSHVTSMLGSAGAAIAMGGKAAMMEPLSTAMGMPSMSGAGGGRMMLSQSMAAGWQNLETSAREYTQLGFYQNMAFGTHPEFGSAGLRNKLMMQQAYAAGPMLPGMPTTGEQMRNMSEQVMAPFAGLMGVQGPAGRQIASAYQSGMMDYTVGARQQMEMHKQIFAMQGANRVYQVGAVEAGQLSAAIASTGTPMSQLAGAQIEMYRAQTAGVPLGVQLGAMSTTNRYTEFMQQTGMVGPGGGNNNSADGLIQGQLIAQKMQNDGYIVSQESRASYGSIVTQLNAMNGKTDRDRINNAVTASQLAFGQAAAHIDGDTIAGMDAQRKYLLHETDAASERMSAGKLSMERLMDSRSMLRDVLGEAASHMSNPMKDFVNRAVGYGPYSPDNKAHSLGPGPGAYGAFSRSAMSLYSTSGGGIAASGRMAEINTAREASGKALSQGDGFGAFQIMAGVGGPVGEASLRKGLEAYMGAKGSNASALKGKIAEFGGAGALVTAALADTSAGRAIWTGVVGTDMRGFLSDYSSGKTNYYTDLEKGAMRLGDPKAADAMRAGIYAGAGLSTDPKDFNDNDAFFGAIRDIGGGKKPMDVYNSLTSDQKKKFRTNLDADHLNINTTDGHRTLSGTGVPAGFGKWTDYQAIQSGAIARALPYAQSGIDAALKHGIEDASGDTKAALQGYAKQMHAIEETTDPRDRMAKMAALRSDAGKRSGAADRQYAKIYDQQWAAQAAGTGQTSQMGSMPFADALINASKALSVVGLLARSVSGGRGGSDNNS